VRAFAVVSRPAQEEKIGLNHLRGGSLMIASRSRRPSPALIVASIALLVATTGTAVAATPVVKRALFANNAGKLQGRTAAQVAAMPGPAASARSLVGIQGREFFALSGSGTTESITCGSGRAVGLRWETLGGGLAVPTSIQETSETTWRVEFLNLRADGPARGTAYLVCLR
jgi:hypothetical protein